MIYDYIDEKLPALHILIVQIIIHSINQTKSLQDWIDKICLLWSWKILSVSMDNIYKKICIERLMTLRGNSTNFVTHGPIIVLMCKIWF